MENQPTKLDKSVKISIIAGTLIVALSIAYYLVIIPIVKEKKLTTCLEEAEKYLNEARENKKEDDGELLKKVGNINGGSTEKERIYLREKEAFDEIQRRAEEAQLECFKKYPQ